MPVQLPVCTNHWPWQRKCQASTTVMRVSAAKSRWNSRVDRAGSTAAACRADDGCMAAGLGSAPPALLAGVAAPLPPAALGGRLLLGAGVPPASCPVSLAAGAASAAASVFAAAAADPGNGALPAATPGCLASAAASGGVPLSRCPCPCCCGGCCDGCGCGRGCCSAMPLGSFAAMGADAGVIAAGSGEGAGSKCAAAPGASQHWLSAGHVPQAEGANKWHCTGSQAQQPVDR